MKKFVLFVVAASVGASALAWAQDKKSDDKPRGDNKRVEIGDVPEKFLKVAKEAMPGAEWTHAEMNTDLGKHPSLVVYEITGKKDGKEVEVDVRADGTVEEMEEVIDMKDVPKPASDLFQSEYPEFKVTKVERSTRPYRNGQKATWYEFKGTTKDGAPLDVEVTEDGKYYAVDVD